MADSGKLVEIIQATAHALTGEARDYDRLIERIGDARFVLLGEASHGTHEFYRERAEITKRIIVERLYGGRDRGRLAGRLFVQEMSGAARTYGDLGFPRRSSSADEPLWVIL